MGVFLRRKLLRAAVTVAMVLLLAFAGARLSGSPFDMVADGGLAAEDRAALEAEFGLNRPLPVQFAFYVAQLAQGQFGRSIAQRRPVLTIYAEAAPVTLRLAGAALLITVLAGVPLGVAAAVFEGGSIGRMAATLAMLGNAVPHFLMGLLLALLFGLVLGWLPIIGQGGWRNFVLPSFTLAAGLTAAIARFVAAELRAALAADFIRTARAGGIGEARIRFVLALRNALLPALTVVGLHLGGLLAGSLIIENVFAMRGIGQVFIGAVQQRDYPVLQFGVMALALVVVAANMAVDVLYAWADPRIRRAQPR
jgi:ABC-type dipeptide/oligopeptide/nickel transport system permease component